MLIRLVRLGAMTENETAIGDDELVVTVEMGDTFEPGSRTSAALHELAAALREEHSDDDVSGFSADKPEALRSFSFAFSPEPSRSFFEAWPSKWKAADLDGKANEP